MVDRLGILGAGKLGTAVARLAVDAGRQVLIADERTGPMIELIVSTVAPGARLVSKDEMLASSDIVLLAIPYSRLTELDLPSFAGAIVIDATNPWLEADGANPPESPLKGQPGMRVVRSMNHLAYEDLGAYAEPAGGPFRTAIAVASDDVAALPGRDERHRVRVATSGPTDLVTGDVSSRSADGDDPYLPWPRRGSPRSRTAWPRVDQPPSCRGATGAGHRP